MCRIVWNWETLSKLCQAKIDSCLGVWESDPFFLHSSPTLLPWDKMVRLSFIYSFPHRTNRQIFYVVWLPSETVVTEMGRRSRDRIRNRRPDQRPKPKVKKKPHRQFVTHFYDRCSSIGLLTFCCLWGAEIGSRSLVIRRSYVCCALQITTTMAMTVSPKETGDCFRKGWKGFCVELRLGFFHLLSKKTQSGSHSFEFLGKRMSFLGFIRFIQRVGKYPPTYFGDL